MLLSSTRNRNKTSKFVHKVLKRCERTANVLGMTALNRTSIADAVQFIEEPPKLWQGPSLFLLQPKIAHRSNGHKSSKYIQSDSVENLTVCLGHYVVAKKYEN